MGALCISRTMTEQYRKYINEENNREFHGDLGGVGQGGGDSPVM